MQTYLVALDNSPRAAAVLTAAVDLARLAKAKLLLFRAIGLPNDLPIEAFVISPDRMEAHLREGGQREIDALAKAVPADVPHTTRVELGTAWQAICRAAVEAKADLVVIGSHGYSGLDRVLGTTAARVVNHADRSVLVVRAPAPFRGG